MFSAKVVARVESITWILIYGGLIAVLLGIVTSSVHFIGGLSLGLIGGLAVTAGIVLIWVRSRMSESPPAGAQSPPNPEGRS